MDWWRAIERGDWAEADRRTAYAKGLIAEWEVFTGHLTASSALAKLCARVGILPEMPLAVRPPYRAGTESDAANLRRLIEKRSTRSWPTGRSCEEGDDGYENPLKAIWALGSCELWRLDRLARSDDRRMDRRRAASTRSSSTSSTGDRAEPARRRLHGDLGARARSRPRASPFNDADRDRQVARPRRAGDRRPDGEQRPRRPRRPWPRRGYPPRGDRSIGPIRAQPDVRVDEIEDLESPGVIVMVETSDGLANVDADRRRRRRRLRSTSARRTCRSRSACPDNRARRTTEQAAAHAEAVERIRQACERAGIVAGMNCSTGEQARGYVEQGFRMVTVTVDADMMFRDGIRELAVAKEKARSA